MRYMPAFAVVALLVLVSGCLSSEQAVAIQDTPDAVIEAAQDAVPGLSITGVWVEAEDGADVYEVEGTTDTMEYEIEISAEGEIIEMEEEPLYD